MRSSLTNHDLLDHGEPMDARLAALAGVPTLSSTAPPTRSSHRSTAARSPRRSPGRS